MKESLKTLHKVSEARIETTEQVPIKTAISPGERAKGNTCIPQDNWSKTNTEILYLLFILVESLSAWLEFQQTCF